jgi:succinylarginine dihydrolase
MASLDAVSSALSLWSAEADSGAPVTDGQLLLLADDPQRLAVALAINSRWRRALRSGDQDVLAVVLADAETFAEEKP